MVGVMRTLIVQDETALRGNGSESKHIYSEMESVMGEVIKKKRKKQVEDSTNDSYNIYEDLQYKEILIKQK